jgi:CheY-like chemotaxis protein
MTVWLYDAHGPERHVCGVTDDEKRARRLARESLSRAGADTALVEQALTALDAVTLIYGYVRTGEG